MKNTTTLKIAKKYQHMILEVYKDYEGYWAYSEKGYKFASTGCHVAHEYNQQDMLMSIRSLEECECKDCKNN